MAYSPTPSTTSSKVASVEEGKPQTVIITGKSDPHAETRALLKEMLEKAPELIEGLTADELDEVRQGVHDMMVGGGSAKTLVGVAEILKGGKELTKKELDEAGVDPNADVDEEIPVTYGQMPQFADMLQRMMCRVADHQLTKDETADKLTAQQTANSPEGADAARHVRENEELRKRLDAACVAPAPSR